MATFFPTPLIDGQGVLQTTTLATGTEQIRPGTDTAFIGLTLTGDLTLTLPSARLYAAGKSLRIKDVIGASSASARVMVIPRTASSNTLNGGINPFVTLSGPGDVEFFSDGVTGWAASSQFQSTQTEEYRTIKTSYVESGMLAASGTVALIDTTANPGPGNVEFIQLALISQGQGGQGQDNALMTDSVIRMTIDGVNLGDIPLGIFYLLYGTGGDGSATPAIAPWWSDNFALMQISPVTPVTFGAIRRLFIPFKNTCKIDLINAGATAAYVYSQVQYRIGNVPLYQSGSRRKRLGYQVRTLGAGTVGTYAALDILNVTGRGQIDSVHLCTFAPAQGATPSILEGNVTVLTDGIAATWGGTEDFFGTQFYGQQAHGAVTDSWGIPISSSAYGGYYIVGAYRIFSKDPAIFNTSAKITIHNGQAGEGNTPSPAGIAAVVFYYLDS